MCFAELGRMLLRECAYLSTGETAVSAFYHAVLVLPCYRTLPEYRGFINVHGNLNKRTFGKDIFLWYRPIKSRQVIESVLGVSATRERWEFICRGHPS